MIRHALLVILLSVSALANAAIDTYEFKDDATRERFQSLAAELRCPKCQNQNIADSNSPIAEDLRNELHRMLEEGADDQQVIDFMVGRYGEFVLYRPRMTEQTYLLWYGPAGLLVIGVVVVLLVSGKRKKAEPGKPKANLSDAEKQKLDQLLKQEQTK
ncbi:cytochrome c-type biogenesis protein CcmH [Amphritea sp. 2_MG-2023]|jgi:cytochrome c-type biogenesis protein CcmH|uniref:cytochrome c-type biogenesis protein n=1 Tax=Amphritea TaxID=515417 RepID=UPI001C07E498|nr:MULTISPECIES: cytochrome c-type biogenesis protein [Amphritea]MBU2964785.1 cytochrome c-type biogenesis protein CcmH [Amphritea atlantica]MDO6419639.1 cytochrome c-type biogenesis protein CcmH [Amphritea sp. 2_MG-2023]MDX2422837.1 cytochrome c-type biogenesis protein CcmH [Amphritea sp.]